MKTILAIAGVGLLGSLATAQTQTAPVSGETLTDIVSAVKINTASDSNTAKKDTKFARFLHNGASVRGGHVSNHASVGTGYDWRNRSKSYWASVTTSGHLFGRDAKDAGEGSANDGAATPGQFKLAFTFDLPKDTKGKFHIQLGGHASKNGATALTAAVDTTTKTWKAGEKAVMSEVDYTFGDKPLVVQIWAEGSAKLSGMARESWSARGMVTFKPEPAPNTTCKVTAGPASCGGTLKGTPSSSRLGHRIACELSGAAKSSLGIVLLSPDGMTATIPSTKCDIFTAVTGLLGIVNTDANGDAKHSLTVPANRKLTFWVQDAMLSFGSKGIDITTSNWLKVECQ